MAETGAVLKASDEDRFLLVVAYSANKMPHRGADGYVDVVAPEALEKACWEFMASGAVVGLWHEPGHEGCARVVENFIHRGPDWTLKAADGTEQTIRQGDWVVGLVLTEPTWALYKAGMIGGASPQGRAVRKPATPGTLARMEG